MTLINSPQFSIAHFAQSSHLLTKYLSTIPRHEALILFSLKSESKFFNLQSKINNKKKMIENFLENAHIENLCPQEGTPCPPFLDGRGGEMLLHIQKFYVI